MQDLISRQEAIDALIEWYGCKPDDIEAFEEIIKALPSAQSERCEDCVNFSKTRLLISPAQPEMTTTAITQAKRFCRYQGIMCEYATDMGCCEITGCAKRRVV